MAASASAGGYWRMLGAFLPLAIAPPLPVALWQPEQYRRKRSPPGETSAVRAAGSASSCATYSATAFTSWSLSTPANGGMLMPPCSTIGATRLAKPAGASGGPT